MIRVWAMAPAGLLSVNVGLSRDVEFRGKIVRTSTCKSPIAAAVRVGRLNLEGDQQADPSVHGGTLKAVYAYPSEHQAYWRSELEEPDIAWGANGENLTTAGLTEDAVSAGENQALLRQAVQLSAPPDGLRKHFRKRLTGPGAEAR